MTTDDAQAARHERRRQAASARVRLEAGEPDAQGWTAVRHVHPERAAAAHAEAEAEPEEEGEDRS